MAAKPTPQTTGDTSTEYEIWYDAPDGARRSMNAEDEPGVQQLLSDLDADEGRRTQLAEAFGFAYTPHDLNITVTKVTTSRQQIQ